MSDRDWQHAVLRDLGVAEAGMAGPRAPEPITLQPEIVPATSAAPHSALPGAGEDTPGVRRPPANLPVPSGGGPREPGHGTGARPLPRPQPRPRARARPRARGRPDAGGPARGGRRVPRRTGLRAAGREPNATAPGHPPASGLGPPAGQFGGVSEAPQPPQPPQPEQRVQVTPPQGSVWTCRRIAVTSIRGGAGKTTLTSLMSSLIAGRRAGQVLAVDADSALGSLALRMGVQPVRSTHDLVVARPGTWEEAAGYLAPSAAGPWVLSSHVDGRMGGELRLDTIRTAVGGLSGYFAAAVIDCGGGIVAPLQRGIVSSAHAQVFVTPGTADGVLSAHGALEWFTRNGHGELLARTVVALVAHSPHGDADLERARQLLGSWGVTVVQVPYDRHLAAGGAIRHRSLNKATQAAAAQIAGDVFARSFEGGGP